MSVTALTPPASSSLISLSQAKLYLSISDSALDSLYTSLITAASSAMIDFMGVHPGRQRYRETSHGTGSSRRYLSRLPVEPGTLTISIDGEAVTETTIIPPTSAESDLFWLEEPNTGKVYRLDTWPISSTTSPNLVDTYHAGYLLPDQIADWAASTAKALGSWVRPTSASPLYPSLYRFECTTAGTTGSTQPTWSTTIGATVTDGSVVWTTCAAQELPAVVSQWCYAEFLRQLKARNVTPGLSSYTVEGVSESFFATQTSGPLPVTVMDGLINFRKKLGVVGVA